MSRECINGTTDGVKAVVAQSFEQKPVGSPRSGSVSWCGNGGYPCEQPGANVLTLCFFAKK